MTFYGLEYTREAENQLALLWLSASDRNGVTRAQYLIDQRLISEPRSGTHMSEGLWRVIVPPLAAVYEIDESGSQVTVTGFGLLK